MKTEQSIAPVENDSSTSASNTSPKPVDPIYLDPRIDIPTPAPLLEAFHETYKTLLDLCEDAYQKKDHESFSIIQTWLDRQKIDKNLLERAAYYKNSDKVTPLHYLAGSNPPLSLLDDILNPAPDVVTLQDANGKLPLHWACCNNVSCNVIRNLLKKYPKAAEVQDYVGCTPLHYGCHYGDSIDAIKVLLKETNEAAKIPNDEGDFPLHISCVQKTSPDAR
jgi:ankyrin repeat protein